MEVGASLSQGRTAAAQCGLFKYKSVPVIFEPPCTRITNEVLDPITFVLACPTVLIFCTYLIQQCKGNDKLSSWRIDSVALFAKDRIKHNIRENIPDKRECDIISEWKTEMKT